MSVRTDRVLGLDTGLRHCGWAVADVAGTFIKILHCGVISAEGKTAMERAEKLARAIGDIMAANNIDVIAYESPSLPPNTGSAWKIGLAFGIVAGLLHWKTGAKFRASPVVVKKAVIPRWKPKGRGRSTAGKSEGKRAVIAAIERRFGSVLSHLRKGLREHAADAIAVIVATAPKIAEGQEP